VNDAVEITCPRCGGTARVRFYGPCDDCRTDLRAKVAGAAREVESAAYEPKMNVTPNQVATKD
jgi:NMD protein affecting ribosome stability and mRNA decay